MKFMSFAALAFIVGHCSLLREDRVDTTLGPITDWYWTSPLAHHFINGHSNVCAQMFQSSTDSKLWWVFAPDLPGWRSFHTATQARHWVETQYCEIVK